MKNKIRLTFLACLPWLAATLPAQWSTIYGSAGYDYRTQLTNQRSLAHAAGRVAGSTLDHTTWSLVGREGTPRRLFLARSIDGGVTWDATQYFLPGLEQWDGSIVTGNDCHTLHVLWTAPNTGGWASVYYIAFNTETATWIGSTVTIASGSSATNRYTAADIEVTAKGRVVIAYANGNIVVPPFTGTWSSVLRVAPPPTPGTQASFPPAGYQINVGSSGIRPNLQAVDEDVHIAYRSAVGGYGIFYRGFDTNTLTFNQAVDVPTGATQASNVACIATDDDCSRCGRGMLYILYAAGANLPGDGRLMLTTTLLSAPTAWTTPQLVANDTPLILGNTTYLHYALAVGEDREVCAVYSRAQDDHTNLYVRRYVDGVASPEELYAASSLVDRFSWVNGLRSTQIMSGPYVTVSGTSTGGVWNDVRVARLGNTARTSSFGRYTGPRTQTPRLAARNTPTMGTVFQLAVDEVDPLQLGILFIGRECAPELPLPPPWFESGSYILQDWIVFTTFSTVPCSNTRSHALIDVPMPPPNPFLVGTGFFLQAVVSFGTPFPLVTTNSMATILDL